MTMCPGRTLSTGDRHAVFPDINGIISGYWVGWYETEKIEAGRGSLTDHACALRLRVRSLLGMNHGGLSIVHVFQERCDDYIQ